MESVDFCAFQAYDIPTEWFFAARKKGEPVALKLHSHRAQVSWAVGQRLAERGRIAVILFAAARAQRGATNAAALHDREYQAKDGLKPGARAASQRTNRKRSRAADRPMSTDRIGLLN